MCLPRRRPGPGGPRVPCQAGLRVFPRSNPRLCPRPLLSAEGRSPLCGEQAPLGRAGGAGTRGRCPVCEAAPCALWPDGHGTGLAVRPHAVPQGDPGACPPQPRVRHTGRRCSPGPRSPVESSSRKGTAGGSMRLVPVSAEGSPRAAVGARGSEGPVSPRPAGCRPQRGQPGSCRGSSVGGRAPRPDVGASRGVAAVGGWRRQPGWAAA